MVSGSQSPAVSVIMSVYNGSATLGTAIETILHQSFTDLELIVINDGSTDGTLEILERYARQDPRVRIIDQENKGLTKALNSGIKKARGRYIARQDVDDFSYAGRLKVQYEFMEVHPEVVLLGANCDSAYPGGMSLEWGWEPPETLAQSVFYKTPFAHSTAFFRTETIRNLGGYDESYSTAQDMELWMRFAKTGNISMISQPLLQRTILPSSISVKRRWRQFYDAFRARWKHNDNKAQVVYHGLRTLLISLLPEKILSLKHSQKS